MCKHRKLLQTIGAIAILLLSADWSSAENIDPDNDGSQYAYGRNVGWVNFEPNRPEPNVGATVSNTKLTGFVWAENIGWISLSCENTGSCATVDYGVLNDGAGNLSGYAWGENVGWINFNLQVPGDPTHYGVTIDHEGNFDGWAWGENIGWIHFRSIYIVDFDTFANFAVQWREIGPGLEADLYEDGNVNWDDLKVFTDYWLDECPADWGLCPQSYNVKTSWTGAP